MAETTEERIKKAKSLDGAIMVGIGPSGCGKTDLMERTSLAAAFINGVEWLCYDSNGDVKVHFNGIMKFHQQQYDSAQNAATADKHMKKLLFLNKCLSSGFYSGPSKLPMLQQKLRDMVAEGHKDAARGVDKKAKAIVFIDEAGAVRDEDDTFWPAMRQARNSGVTIYTTGHRVKDWHPAARTNIRIAVLWKPRTEKFIEINGHRIPREVCGEPKHHIIKFVIGDDPIPYVWDRSKNPEGYPVELIVPAQPTVARVAGF